MAKNGRWRKFSRHTHSRNLHTYLSRVLSVIYKFYHVKLSVSLWLNGDFLILVKLSELIITSVRGTSICCAVTGLIEERLR
jgi:hypothetical protein